MEYNTTREDLIIPEYGRHIQKMVDVACELKTKEERKKASGGKEEVGRRKT